MPADRLAIPLHENPARQKFWRAVGFFGLLVGAVILGYFVDRAIHYRSSSQRWPHEANLEVRLIKTPRTTKLVNEGYSAVQALPGTPWSIAEALSWSRREFILYFDNETVVGMAIDGDLPEETHSALQLWGWETVAVGKRTLIIQTGDAEPNTGEKNTNIWLTIPIFDGGVTMKSPNNDKAQSVPFRLSSAYSLDFPVNTEAFISKSNLALPSDTVLTGSFTLPADFSDSLLPESVPASFPGLQTLGRQASLSGVDVLIGQDSIGTAFVMAMPLTGLSLEEMGEIVTEGVSLQNLSTFALTSGDLPTRLEIRGADEVTVDVSNNDGIAVAVAKTAEGDIFRLTQTRQQLILSNREPVIGLSSATYTGTCLKRPDGFLSPATLLSNLPLQPRTHGYSITDHVRNAREVAYQKNWLRVCW